MNMSDFKERAIKLYRAVEAVQELHENNPSVKEVREMRKYLIEEERKLWGIDKDFSSHDMIRVIMENY